MNYTNFKQYPIQILGINESYNDELKAIETLVIGEIEYSGEQADIAEILPYFVFFKFCESKFSEVTTKGEMLQVAEFSVPSVLSQVRAWNIGAKKLDDLCTANETTASDNYRSQRNILW